MKGNYNDVKQGMHMQSRTNGISMHLLIRSTVLEGANHLAIGCDQVSQEGPAYLRPSTK